MRSQKVATYWVSKTGMYESSVRATWSSDDLLDLARTHSWKTWSWMHTPCTTNSTPITHHPFLQPQLESLFPILPMDLNAPRSPPCPPHLQLQVPTCHLLRRILCPDFLPGRQVVFTLPFEQVPPRQHEDARMCVNLRLNYVDMRNPLLMNLLLLHLLLLRLFMRRMTPLLENRPSVSLRHQLPAYAHARLLH